MSHHSWLYCITFGVGSVLLGGVAAVVYWYIWATLFNLLEPRFGEDKTVAGIFLLHIFVIVSTLIALTCKGVIH